MVAEIKDKISRSDDFSADEVIALANKVVGKFSAGPTWCVNSAAQEQIGQLESDLAAMRSSKLQVETAALVDRTELCALRTAWNEREPRLMQAERDLEECRQQLQEALKDNIELVKDAARTQAEQPDKTS